MRARRQLRLHGRLQIRQVLVPEALPDVGDHRVRVLLRILGKGIRQVEHARRAREVGVDQAALVALLEEAGARALDLAGGVEVLADDDQPLMLDHARCPFARMSLSRMTAGSSPRK